ncbi:MULTISPECIES: SIS domain-containing protein [Paenarthrobacter]|jgi:fructoselysine-6-P-deglycase FrlB-like protein|uniref:SIS domain-containing protein n=1 Tax=Paenarthrobacter TaxID=1742992 RepID=UPI000367931B|nr:MULTISPECIES: SIS domain-containing protein [Paenarthrobacter]KQR01649.1 sugar isomerase [Arthrobacter sp. Leaf145]SKB45660.1 Fructoselysine-6-P-deglycase FrlB with duplicated sugar isomerase (SIS) domain [Arthrobacter sp. 31Cvi3.1E]MDI2023661.1 Glutamine--fructose-6-phosphate aminotransferase [isomerizing] [Paenarthrobacter nicotinovorans]QOT22035.1 SIS domain-containing protein [Paenarthrobacter sp. YJN-D]GAT86300.1 sugar isomerase [Paenarthrobacter nicotinovorans]
MSENILGAFMEEELVSQPVVWQRAVEQARSEDLLPADGKRIAVIGCGTSWFMAQSYAAARESAGKGVTDAFAASEAFLNSNSADRQYDAVVAITRSGTTTEVLEILAALKGIVPTVAIIGDTTSPIIELADTVIGLQYADERSVVQTRFATTALVYMLTSLDIDVQQAIADARDAVSAPVPQELLDAEQFTFLGTGWTVGLAHEAGLKMREAVQGWTESYPAMEYRHGPISIAAPGRVTWLFGTQPEGLDQDMAATGALYLHTDKHPLAELARVHKVTLERARVRGLNPDLPRNLTRSVILDASA